jgi:uncharacterized protein YbjT (DUF2867 family)
MSQILVIGSTGKVGKELIQQLAAKQIKVKAATRNVDSFAAANDFIAPVKFDMEDNSTFAEALAVVDKVFMIAPPLRSDSKQLAEPFINAAKEAGIKCFVFMSASGVSYSDDNPLRQVEMSIEAADMPYTFLRPNFFMENFTAPEMGGLIKNMGGFFLNADDGKTAFLSASDIAASAVKVLTEDGHLGNAYTLTGSESLDHSEVAAIMSEVTGKTIAYTAIPDEAMTKGFMDAGMPESAAQYMVFLYQFVKQGIFAEVSGDMEKLLGKKPITFKEFALQHKDAWM